VHILAVVGRVAAFCVAVLAFYMAFFMYEDEQGRWQNQLDLLWTSIYDRSNKTHSTTTALFNKLGETLSSVLNLMFGAKLLSLISICTSIILSIAGATLVALALISLFLWHDATAANMLLILPVVTVVITIASGHFRHNVRVAVSLTMLVLVLGAFVWMLSIFVIPMTGAVRYREIVEVMTLEHF
jgi:hypothetical protein